VIALHAAAIDAVIPVSSSRVADPSKPLENIVRSVKIAPVNELKMTCARHAILITCSTAS